MVGVQDSVTQKGAIALQASLLLVLLLSVYKSVIHIPILDVVFGFASLLVSIVALWVCSKQVSKWDAMLLFGLLVLALYAQLVSQKGALLFYQVVGYALLGFSFGLLVREKRWPVWLLPSFGYLALVPFLYGFFIKGIDLGKGGEFLGLNRNFIPRLLFMSTTLVLVGQYVRKQRLSLLLPLLSVVVSFLSRSRAGLLISSALFVLTLLEGYTHIPIRAWVRGHRVLAVGLVLMVIVALSFAGMYLVEHSRLSSQGLESNGRMEIYLAFLKGLDVQKAFFGSRPAILDTIGLHDSYLTFLAMFGIFSLAVLAMLAFTFAMLFKEALFLCGVFSLWLVYSVVEALSPFAEGDVLLVCVMVLAIGVSQRDA